ncbi:outer membrane lipoprotein carrier protein LolA [Acetobacter sp. TBRC 12305]|uniref:Outer membrane lipoprotein carrier protein LolA n=2 Tax=Acetobacter garciniae TaxID=2817435 RepID=A0A939HGR5_9PROT|nr:outer membrane lipoprotein carrier protein LolA [Acetobacter garciniae]MBX0343792.1 outer membrane lipoprotein carrier protein LolA [Acetobacter garciniae]
MALMPAALAPLALAACATSQGGAPGPGVAPQVARVEAYLRHVNLAEEPFTQVWPDGAHGGGVLTYRPGALDMQYTAPHAMELRASGHHAVFTDSQSGSETRIGLAHNPLGLLLDDPVRLSGPVTVTDLHQGGGFLQLSLTRTDNPSQGLVTLRFRDSGTSLTLYEVHIVDERRQVTLITLTPV